MDGGLMPVTTLTLTCMYTSDNKPLNLQLIAIHVAIVASSLACPDQSENLLLVVQGFYNDVHHFLN